VPAGLRLVLRVQGLRELIKDFFHGKCHPGSLKRLPGFLHMQLKMVACNRLVLFTRPLNNFPPPFNNIIPCVNEFVFLIPLNVFSLAIKVLSICHLQASCSCQKTPTLFVTFICDICKGDWTVTYTFGRRSSPASSFSNCFETVARAACTLDPSEPRNPCRHSKICAPYAPRRLPAIAANHNKAAARVS